ncbi:RluA family pseudouridine synthase [Geothrix sp. 21YS21S-2]|uniref:RluA family pseudouridine synthase n=1 Tax=Geothrix sp. 21YS21S-2 TaxID=3068893 RepID=UPI0027B8F092|nr:RluA family pseudouridine synthase [Geothrix sp. 21YS21S-2]
MARSKENWTGAVEGTALAAELHRKLEVSHRQAKGLIDAGCVKVNGLEVRTYGQRLTAGDVIDVVFDPDMVYSAQPKPSRSADCPFTILLEDKHLVFVDKPAGLLTVPAEKNTDPCLAEALTDLYRRRGFKRFQLFIAHRLDRFTSGVLVFAKTPEALNGLKRIFDEHHLHRIYKAILVGELPENAGTLSDKLVERKSLRMQVVPENSKAKHDVKGAKVAITHYRVLERLPGHTVVEVKLETGRRNQIRVQFADRGFPLLGDQVYGSPSPIIDRQALHAELLGFRHPVTGESVTASAPLPSDMEKALKALRTARRVERADAGLKGEADIYKPKITAERKLDRVRRAERYTKDEPRRAPSGREDAPRPRRAAGPRDDAPRPRRAAGPGDDAPRPRRPADARPAGGRPVAKPTGGFRKPGPKKG